MDKDILLYEIPKQLCTLDVLSYVLAFKLDPTDLRRQLQNLRWYNEAITEFDELLLACAYNDYQLFKIIMHKEAYISDTKESEMPYDAMFLACANGNTQMITLMEEKESYVPYDIGLAGACSNGQIDIAKFMIKRIKREIECTVVYYHNYNLNRNIDHALQFACRNGSADIIQFLINNGASDWDNGLLGACQAGNTTVAMDMINRGAKNWRAALKSIACISFYSLKYDSKYSFMPYCWTNTFLKINIKGHRELFEQLVPRCKGKSKRDYFDYLTEILSIIIKNDRADLIDILLKYCKSNWNAILSYACRYRSEHVAEFVLKNGSIECYNCDKRINKHFNPWKMSEFGKIVQSNLV